MRKQTKALVALLLLAIVLSAFGVFASFADEAAAVEGPVTIFDLAGGIGSTSITKTVNVTKKTSGNKVTYYTYTYKDTNVTSEGKYTEQGYVQVNPIANSLADGYNASGVMTDDAADYLVIDLDLGTDTNLFNKLRFQTRFYERASNGGTGTSRQNGHWRLWGDSGENVYFTNTEDSTKRAVTQSETEWQHITMVIDVSGGSRNRMSYLYYNGEYVASRVCFNVGMNYLQCIRILFGQTSVARDFANESASLANFTIKAFPKGYSGELAADYDKIGNAEYTLSDFSDLAYTMENLPMNTVAEITRGEETIAFTSFVDLEKAIQEGDTVKLYRDLTRQIIVPENVTFDKNGFGMVDPLVNPDWMITTGSGDLLGAGKQVYSVADDGTKTLVTDTLYEFILNNYGGVIGSKTLSNDDKVVITLYNDIESNNSDFITIGARTLEVDLNGYTWTLRGKDKHLFSLSEASTKAYLILRDGKFIKDVAPNLIYMSNDAKADVINCTIESSRTLIDQRSGEINFIGCTLISKVTSSSESLISPKSFNTRTALMTFEDCELIANTNRPMFALTSVSSGKAGDGAGRYGGMNVTVEITGGSISAPKGSFMTVTTYASEHDGAVGNSKENKNYASVTFDGVDITVSGAVVQTLLSTLHSSYTGKVAENIFAEGLIGDNDISFVDCELNVHYLLTQSEAGYGDAVELFGKEVVDGNYTFDTDVTISGCTIKHSKAFTSNSGVSAITLNFAGVTNLTTNVFGNGAAQVAPIATYAEGFKLAYANDKTYDFIVTDSFDTYTYTLGNATEEFYWNKGEAADIDRVVTLADTDLYSYSWTEAGNAYIANIAKDFKISAKSNLTLVENFQFNLYIPAEQYNAYGEYITVADKDGKALEGEIVMIGEVEYIKFKVKNIAPAEAEANAMKVTIAFAGAYGDEFSVSNELTVLDYASRAKASGNDSDVAFIDAILNYISTAYAYANKDAANVNALISEDAEFATEIEGEAKLGSAEGLEIALNYGADLNWVIKANAATTVVVEYTYEGKATSTTKELAEGDIFGVSFKAYDMINSIKVNGAEINLKGYYEALSDEDAKAMVLAIYNYVKAAADYKAV